MDTRCALGGRDLYHVGQQPAVALLDGDDDL